MKIDELSGDPSRAHALEVLSEALIAREPAFTDDGRVANAVVPQPPAAVVAENCDVMNETQSHLSAQALAHIPDAARHSQLNISRVSDAPSEYFSCSTPYYSIGLSDGDKISIPSACILFDNDT